MSQSSVHSQRQIKWQSKPLITYDCLICVTTNTDQLLELPCGHNVNKKILRKKKANLFLNSYVYHVYI
jgi:biotin synthase-related radical SAM superfamily protein